MSSKEDLIQALQRFEEKTRSEEIDKEAKAVEFKSLIGNKMLEIRNWVPKVSGIQALMGPSVSLGGLSLTSLNVTVLGKKVSISPNVLDEQYSIKIDGLFDGVQYFHYINNEWVAKDDFLDVTIKLTPETFYDQLIALIPK